MMILALSRHKNQALGPFLQNHCTFYTLTKNLLGDGLKNIKQLMNFFDQHGTEPLFKVFDNSKLAFGTTCRTIGAAMVYLFGLLHETIGSVITLNWNSQLLWDCYALSLWKRHSNCVRDIVNIWLEVEPCPRPAHITALLCTF